MSETSEPKVLLPLDQPRSIAIRASERTFTWNFKRLAQADWTKYFEGIVNRVLRHNGQEERVFEADSAMVELIDRTLKSVDGYDFDLAIGEAWKHALPLRHRIAVGLVLRNVGCERTPDTAALGPFIEVPLLASWSAGDAGKVTMYSGLVHRFRHPSIEQLRKFNFEAARTRILGAADEGVTVFPARQAIAMRLYDELIDSVDGYAVNGEPLADVESIAREMDGAHKATAALALFEAGESIDVL